MPPKRAELKMAAGGGLVVICDMSMVAVLVKVLPPLKNWSAPKLPVAGPPALIDTVPLAGWVAVGVDVGPRGVLVRVSVEVGVRVGVGPVLSRPKNWIAMRAWPLRGRLCPT